MFEYTYTPIGKIGDVYESIKDEINNANINSVFKVCTNANYSLKPDGMDRIQYIFSLPEQSGMKQCTIFGRSASELISDDTIIYRRDFDHTLPVYESAEYIDELLTKLEQENMPLISSGLLEAFQEELLGYFTANSDEFRDKYLKGLKAIEFELNRIFPLNVVHTEGN